MNKSTESPFENLVRRVLKTETGCWLFLGCRTHNGYGIYNYHGIRGPAHRIMWKLLYGGPGDRLVLHKCDVRPCVNPNHLFLGTAADNTQDMLSKGRNVSYKKKFCHRGHDMALAYISPAGKRNCRECLQINDKLRRAS